LHALDGLRGTMMLLGVVLHTAVSYTVQDLGEAWPYKDPARTYLADLVVAFIHVFRMPVFFALAGFFAAMLYLRRGGRGLLSNRLQRIGIPLAVGLVVLFPLVTSGYAFANAVLRSSIGDAWRTVLALAATPELYIPTWTMHLWFLYDLLYFYVAALLLARACAYAPRAWSTFAAAAFRRIVERPVVRVLVLALVTAMTLLPMDGVLSTHFGFAPDVLVLTAYGVYFALGWVLYGQRDLLRSFERHAWLQATGAVVIYFAARLFVLPVVYALLGSWWTVVFSLVNAVVVSLLFFGLTGLFLRYLDRPSSLARYVVDASYWVYLVHLPCAIWVTGLLAGTSLSVWTRMLIVFATATIFGFVTYDSFVRSTLIGEVLNGRRYPRGLPPVSAADARPPVAGEPSR
jgi:peptidoglycan/LPS O-acetylase OafA/YrhL